MSILITGMEMPKDCWNCPLVNTSPCPCKGYSTALEHVTDRHPVCPLAEVPPHGRLIDKDALDICRREEQARLDYEHNPDDEYLEGVKDGLHESAKQLSIAPTIIPAEEGK